MFKILLLSCTLLISTLQMDPVVDQLQIIGSKTKGPIGTLTTSSGEPVEKDDTGSTLNKNLIRNTHLMDTLTNFMQENIPERIVHMKGTGAFGYFKTTHDISNICAANFLEMGKKTPMVARFSVGLNERGAPDSSPTVTGFGVKFYTLQGNFDILGVNTPIFSFKDPSAYSPFIRMMRRNPATNLPDVNMTWDVVASYPESLYLFLMMYGGYGVPSSYRDMPGYGVHTYQVYNSTGHSSFVRWHFIPAGGRKYMNATQAASLACSNRDYYIEDLYRSIGNGKYPKWNVGIQVLSQEDVKNAKFNVFDITKALPEDKYPVRPVGNFVLNRNPKNYFTDIEQLALNPGNLVPGILGAPDKVFEARLMFYRQAQSYRLGKNYNKIPVNCPYRTKVFTYHRNGVGPVGDNGYNTPNYFPNSFNGPAPYTDKKKPDLMEICEDEPNNFDQAREYYTNQMSSNVRNGFVQIVGATLCYAANDIQDRIVAALSKIHRDLGVSMAKALKKNKCKK